jgi:signal transduction histidine kinase
MASRSPGDTEAAPGRMKEDGPSTERTAPPDPSAMDESAVELIEAGRFELAFERLYRRTRRYYLQLLLFFVFLSVHLLILPTFVLMSLPLWDAGLQDYGHILLVWELAAILGALGLWILGYRHHRSLIRRQRGDPSGTAVGVWRETNLELPRSVAEIVACYMLAVGVAQIYVGLERDFPPVATALAITAIGFMALGVGVFQYLLFEFALRPVVREVAPLLPVDFSREHPALSLERKLLIVLPVITLLSGASVGALTSVSLELEGQLAVMVGATLAVSATVAGVLTMMLRRSLLLPVLELRHALGRLREGDTEVRLGPLGGEEFDEVGLAFNELVERFAEYDAEMRESRARIVAASDAERKRVERNLHDGAQQHLVGLALQLRLLEETSDDPGQRAALEGASAELSNALSELRELARGLHPQVLSVGGLGAALPQLADRVPVPVEVRSTEDRFPEAVESTAYFVVSEALANVAKYANASCAEVCAERSNGDLVVSVTDDGVGGADATAGSGLVGLVDRVAALEGKLDIESSPGAGTTVTVQLPLD